MMKQKYFTEEEMTSDPDPPKPDMTFVEEEEQRGPVKPRPKSSRASEWFNRNRVTRVPMIALEEDMYKIKGQNWVCFSVIKPEEYRALHHDNRNYHGYLIKFRGCFDSREAAEKHIHKVMAVDKHFDIHLIPAFTWSGVEDDVIEDREYADEMIGQIMKGYFEQENNRSLDIRDRIRRTENIEEGGDRSEEVSKFFDEANSSNPLAAIEDDLPEGLKPMSLDDLAREMGIEPGGKAREDSIQLPKDKYESVVSEIILEDQEEEDK